MVGSEREDAERDDAQQVAQQVEVRERARSNEHLCQFFQQYANAHDRAARQDVVTAYPKRSTLHEQVYEIRKDAHHEEMADLVAARD